MTLQQLKYIEVICRYNSMNQASKELFISQPSLSQAVKEIEMELGFEIFLRSNKGITLTNEGTEFLSYARQVLAQFQMIEDRYLRHRTIKHKFSVSMQHYTFAVKAFIDMMQDHEMEDYEFEVHETKTHEVIANVKNMTSEVGIIYINDFNRQVIEKILKEYNLEFISLFDCDIYVYLAKKHPLAKQKVIGLEELKPYPMISFHQGANNSFYFAEEVLSTYDYEKIIKVNDRATSLNFIHGQNAYTLCSGIICNELNGGDYTSVKLDTEERMTIGYLKIKDKPLTKIGQLYIEKLKVYENNRIDSTR